MLASPHYPALQPAKQQIPGKQEMYLGMARSRALFSSQIAPQHLVQSTHHTGFPGTHTLSSKLPQNNHIKSVHTNSSAFADRTSPDLGSQHEAYSTPRALFFSIFTLKSSILCMYQLACMALYFLHLQSAQQLYQLCSQQFVW